MNPQTANPIPSPQASQTFLLGYWAALLTTLGGLVYFMVILFAILNCQFTFPPPGFWDRFTPGGVAPS